MWSIMVLLKEPTMKSMTFSNLAADFKPTEFYKKIMFCPAKDLSPSPSRPLPPTFFNETLKISFNDLNDLLSKVFPETTQQSNFIPTCSFLLSISNRYNFGNLLRTILGSYQIGPHASTCYVHHRILTVSTPSAESRRFLCRRSLWSGIWNRNSLEDLPTMNTQVPQP